VDDGRGGMVTPGNGLKGLEERVRERRGVMSAEPLPHEGFRLRVRVPIQGPHPDPPPRPEEGTPSTISKQTA
jgi:hypothetical protein